MSTKVRYALVGVVLVTSLGGFALGQLQLRPTVGKSVTAGPVVPAPPMASPTAPLLGAALGANGTESVTAPVAEAPKPVNANADTGSAPATSRRREAVIRAPVGTFVKDMDVGKYGSGRLTWTFEEDRVLGIIEANVMGVEVELRTEADFSLSRNGTIYGVVTSVELTHLKVGAIGELGEIAEFVPFAKLAEPLLIEVLTDLPFSYQFRLSGDKLTILSYRALLAGPNPLGKLGGLMAGGDEGLAVLSYFQALGVAIEGTYTAGEAEPRDKSKTKPIVRKPTGKK